MGLQDGVDPLDWTDCSTLVTTQFFFHYLFVVADAMLVGNGMFWGGVCAQQLALLHTCSTCFSFTHLPSLHLCVSSSFFWSGAK